MERVGPYRIIRQLGSGAMGEVWLAEHELLKVLRALKFLPRELADFPGFRERFLSEGRILASLEHPGIVQVHDMGIDGATCFLVMDFVSPDGRQPQTVEDYVRAQGGRLSPEQASSIMLQVCSAVQFAHDHGVVHCDLKPSNVLLGPGRTVQVSDFGLAKVLGTRYVQESVAGSLSGIPSSRKPPSEGPQLRPADGTIGIEPTLAKDESRATSLVGTFHYMPPEVQEGDEWTAQGDVFSLGVLAYVLLTGRRPVGRWRLPSETVPGVPKAWDSLVAKALEARPQDRYATASELESEVAGCAAATCGSAHSVSRGFRHRAVVFSLLAAIAATAGSLVWISGQNRIAAGEYARAVPRPSGGYGNPEHPIPFIADRRMQLVEIRGNLTSVSAEQHAGRPATPMPAPSPVPSPAATATPVPTVDPVLSAARAEFDNAMLKESFSTVSVAEKRTIWDTYLKSYQQAGYRVADARQKLSYWWSDEADREERTEREKREAAERQQEADRKLRQAGEDFAANQTADRDPDVSASRKADHWREYVARYRSTDHRVADAESLRSHWTELAAHKSHEYVAGGVSFRTEWISGGSFRMGDDHSESVDTAPAHDVSLSGFWMGKTEVTQRLYEAVMGSNPSKYRGPELPVQNMTWNEAIDFCDRLSRKTGLRFTLPTEAQWEYACRGNEGGRAAFALGRLETYAWMKTNAGGCPHPVALKPQNPFGLHDILGNVWELCLDKYSTTYYRESPTDNPRGPDRGFDSDRPEDTEKRVSRGGCYASSPSICTTVYRSAQRSGEVTQSASGAVGFRVVRNE